MKKVLIILTVVTAVFSTHAIAEPYYGGIQYNMITYSEDGYPDADVGALAIQLGAYVNEYFALEGRFGFGIDDDEVDIGLPSKATFELDNYYGAYIRGVLPTEKIKPYVIIGFTKSEVTFSYPGFGSVSDDDSDFSYGIGIDFNLSKKVSAGIEYMSLIDESDYELTSINLGAKFYFYTFD